MPTVTVNIRDTAHQVTCDETNVARLEVVADYFNKHIDKIYNQIASSCPNVPTITLILVAALQLQDELLDLPENCTKIANEKNNGLKDDLKKFLFSTQQALKEQKKLLESLIK